MDSKEKIMFNHYKNKIENRTFDEYDIYGFLILIREHIPKGTLDLIHEFADTIAHRKKDKGIIINNIKNCIKNKYATINGKKVIGYNAYSKERWSKEWKKVMDLFNIKITKIILKEISVCVFSLFQNVEYTYENQEVGHLRLLINPDSNEIYLCTSATLEGSYLVCFTKIDNIVVQQNASNIINSGPCEALRKDGVLQLENENGIICKIN